MCSKCRAVYPTVESAKQHYTNCRTGAAQNAVLSIPPPAKNGQRTTLATVTRPKRPRGRPLLSSYPQHPTATSMVVGDQQMCRFTSMPSAKLQMLASVAESHTAVSNARELSSPLQSGKGKPILIRNLQSSVQRTFDSSRIKPSRVIKPVQKNGEPAKSGKVANVEKEGGSYSAE